MTIVGEPKIDHRSDTATLGIRVQTPMSGMSKVLTKLFKELATWQKKHDVQASGAPFVRYHVIDMQAGMDIEVGIPVATPLEGDDRVKPAILPAGRYASLIYTGSGLTGNKALIEWAQSQGLAWDRWDDTHGDAFRSRYESYLTDPKIEPHKTKWEVEVAIKLADA